MNKHRTLLGLLLTTAALFVGILWWTAPPHRITQASADQIQLGITLAEVTAIVGVRPGNYGPESFFSDPGRGHNWWFGMRPEAFRECKPDAVHTWFASSGTILTMFDSDGRLCHKEFWPFAETFREWLRRRTGL